MFDSTSRYYKIDQATLTVTDADGLPREIRYVHRRFIPPPETMTTLLEYRFVEGDRLDNITARYLNDPTLFWRVCDANNAMSVDEIEVIGKIIRIAMANS
jgi:hypothetical protein